MSDASENPHYPGRLRHLVYLGVVLLSFASCQLGPKYYPPNSDVSTEWKSENSTVQTERVDFWWEIFHDEVLDNLELEAIGNNPDLYIALERVLYARAIAGHQLGQSLSPSRPKSSL